MKQFMQALKMLIIMSVFLGLVYPLVVYGLAQIAFPASANGSLVSQNGRVVGSMLIGQTFEQAKYFHSRPSACKYDAANSSASNLGPMNDALLDGAKSGAIAYRQENGLPESYPVSSDAVLMSGSGLDPHITLANSLDQAARVAEARKLPKQKIVDAIRRQVQEKTFGLIGSERVNVLQLNVALDNGVI
ncbi:MAG: potassium-transporting ATPase subunit KdpC [Bacillota bacterium]